MISAVNSSHAPFAHPQSHRGSETDADEKSSSLFASLGDSGSEGETSGARELGKGQNLDMEA